MMDPHTVIRMPLLSEKGDRLKEKQNKIILSVDTRANKTQVKAAIEAIFNVKVVDVNMMNVKGKVKRIGMRKGKRPDWKKAVVTIAEGSKVDFIEGV